LLTFPDVVSRSETRPFHTVENWASIHLLHQLE
jgi:hypothetical protein